MKKIIDMFIECPACQGTGVYSGIGEGKNSAVVCRRCSGTGQFHYTYEYEEFTGRKIQNGIDRVYLDGYGYKIGTGVIDFSGVGKVDMDKEGVSYQEFLNGKMPQHIKKLACPLMADQGACHRIKDFTEQCNKLNGRWIGYIPSCTYRDNSDKCWKRFEEGNKK